MLDFKLIFKSLTSSIKEIDEKMVVHQLLISLSLTTEERKYLFTFKSLKNFPITNTSRSKSQSYIPPEK